ncbi:uncharacterized protein BDR25DRAFT_320247 [Lindgomyces ingoldianus]|uniref:Uncharacterized protein n=1 Tax=Lindgomyces ingoldianus TaxID=673940 RepID=A0ACB6Q825_9PLEO|nr:uncharacterized protein BDR25DRAFT_320247 [Lindgomyces ingoldianus]KAF2463054.1 hypothetical protein BDR25DRAFT_320247 [Lindgomyces ingoldianus]
MKPSSGSSLFFGLFFFPRLASAVTLNVTSIDQRNCPFAVKASPLSDGSGLIITYDTKNTALASIGLGVPAKENRKLCYISVYFDVAPNRRVTFESLETKAAVKLDKGIEAYISADFIWPYFTGWAHLNKTTISGPRADTLKTRFTDSPKYQSYCRFSGPSVDNNTDPIGSGVHIRTHFNLTRLLDASASATGELGKNTTVTQQVNFSYSEPCVIQRMLEGRKLRIGLARALRGLGFRQTRQHDSRHGDEMKEEDKHGVLES